jgi:hypothetical protein
MKAKFLLSLIAVLFSIAAFGQELPKPSDIPKEYRAEYKDEYKDAKQYLRKEAENWDINLNLAELVGIPSIADFTNWGVEQLRPDAIYNELYSRCTYRVVVKVNDTSQEWYHPDLKDFALPGSDYSGDNTPQTDQGHGIHVGGIIGGKEGGIAYPCVKKGLVKGKPVQVLNDNGSGSFNWVATAIETEDIENKQLISEGVAVVCNYSLGGGTNLINSVEEKFKASNELGVVHVAANGNSASAVNYPGKSPYTYGVSSLDQNLRISSFSSRGKETDYAAPGRGINSTYKNNTYASLSGTSMATPFVAGLVAIAQSVYGLGKLPNQAAVENYFDWIATDLGDAGQDDLYGIGLVYVKAILDNDPVDNPNNPDSPPPPSCSDGKQNGKETGVDCGGDCPPCDDEPEEPEVVFPERILTVELDANKLGANWRALWVESGSSTASFEPISFELDSELSAITAQGEEIFSITNNTKHGWIDIERFTIRVVSKKDAEITAKEIKTFIDNNWSGNRGVGIEAPGDFASGGKWVAYFTDLLADRRNDPSLEITVESMAFNNERGQHLVWESRDLPQWPRGSDPFDVPLDFSIELGNDNVVYYRDHNKEDGGRDDIKAAWTIIAEWGKEVTTVFNVSQGGLPTYQNQSIKQMDSRGIYVYNIQSVGRPDVERIKKSPPFNQDNWELLQVISVEKAPKY